MDNTTFGENTLYVQRMFSYYPANTKQFTENQQVTWGGVKRPFGKGIKARF